jgi:hypothetical protein
LGASSTATKVTPSSGFSPTNIRRVDKSRDLTKTVYTSTPSLARLLEKLDKNQLVAKFSTGATGSGAAVARANKDFSRRAE